MQKLDDVFRNIIEDIAKKYKIKSDLIIDRLLSDEDKEDLSSGRLPLSSLDLHVKVWIGKGMPDYAHGKTEPMLAEYEDF